jgi:hypothetical protein
MIYVFNSAYYAKYTTNVLNTLFFPKGMVNEYRYTFEGDTANVHGSFLDTADCHKKGEKVAVIFVDRYAKGGYRFIPLRLGKYAGYRKEQHKLVIAVELTEFINIDDSDEFNQEFKQSFANIGIPALTNNDPMNIHDGNYVFCGEDRFLPSEQFTADDTWTRIVESLERTEAFKTTEKSKPVFLYSEILNSAGVPITPSVKKDESCANINRNEIYKIKIGYRFPFQLNHPQSEITMGLNFSDSLFPIDKPEMPINNFSNNQIFQFRSKKLPEELNGTFGISFPNDVVGPDKSINFCIKERNLFVILGAICVLLYIVCTVVVGVDLSTLDPLTFENFFRTYGIQFLASFGQALFLLGIIYFLGKKVI